MDGANLAAFLEMFLMINYELDTSNLGRKIEPNKNKKEPWDIVFYAFMRRSASGFIFCVKCTCILAIKGTEDHETIQFRSIEVIVFGGC